MEDKFKRQKFYEQHQQILQLKKQHEIFKDKLVSYRNQMNRAESNIQKTKEARSMIIE